MDVLKPSLNVHDKNSLKLENLSRDELIQNCRNLISVAQEYRDAMVSLQEEFRILKSNNDRSIYIASKINVLKCDKTHITASCNQNTSTVYTSDFNSASTSATEDLKQQLTWMPDDKDLFVTNLDVSEKLLKHLGEIGVDQSMTRYNRNLKSKVDGGSEDVQKMLGESLDEIMKLKYENHKLSTKIVQLHQSMFAEREFHFKHDEQSSQNLKSDLKDQLLVSRNSLDIKRFCLRGHGEVTVKNNSEPELKNLDCLDVGADINIEVERKNALVEMLQDDERNIQPILSGNQVLSSGITPEMETDKERLVDKIKFYHGKMIRFAIEIRKLRTDKEIVLLAFKEYNSNVKMWKDKLEKLSNFLDLETTKNDNLIESKLLSQKYNACSTFELSQDNAITMNRLNLTEEMGSGLSMDKIVILISKYGNLSTTILQHGKYISNLLKPLKVGNSISIFGNISEEYFSTLKHESDELATERNLINQALKRYRKAISQYQTEYKKMLGNHHQNECELNELLLLISESRNYFSLQKATYSHVETGIVQNEINIPSEPKALEQEDTVKDIKKSDCEYLLHEVISASSISRTEDLVLFKELGISWEERYNRLRSLALRQKAKIHVLTVQLTEAGSNNSNLIHKLTNSMHLVQTLHGQCDDLTEELKNCKDETAQYCKKLGNIAQDINLDKISLGTNDDVIHALRTEVNLLENENAKIELWKKQVGTKVQSLKKKLESNEVLKLDFESKLTDINAQLDQKDRLLREEMNHHVETKKRLQLFLQCKKESVLDVEKKDCERSRNELNHQLEKRIEMYNKLQEHVNALNQNSTIQHEQIQILETKIMKLNSEMAMGNQEIMEMQNRRTSVETILSEKEIYIHDLMEFIEKAKQENDDLNKQLSKVTTGHLKSMESARHERDVLQLQVLGLEQRLTEMNENMRLRDMELSTAQFEYNCYKVRAQSVLRQNHSCDIGAEEKLNEEVNGLKSFINIMQGERTELRNSLTQFKVSNDELTMQKKILDNEIADTQRSMNDQKDKYNILSQQYDATVREHSENVRILKVQSDTLVNCYRKKLNEIESRKCPEILELQGHVHKCSDCHCSGLFEHVSILRSPEIPFRMAREAAEGSEFRENPSPMIEHIARSNNYPLEQLLNVTTDDIDVSGLRQQLADHESRVKHLTELLADTEQDLAKHVQMNVMLKEEIRRKLRSDEREMHIENLEYMKNIIIKFITLSNGDERQRLVPVLNTILRLSPDETTKINAILKEDNRGWSNFLPTWSKLQ